MADSILITTTFKQMGTFYLSVIQTRTKRSPVWKKTLQIAVLRGWFLRDKKDGVIFAVGRMQ